MFKHHWNDDHLISTLSDHRLSPDMSTTPFDMFQRRAQLIVMKWEWHWLIPRFMKRKLEDEITRGLAEMYRKGLEHGMQHIYRTD